MAGRSSVIRRKISMPFRYSIYEADHYQCVYCGTSLRDVAPKERTLDHVKPVSKWYHPRHEKEVNAFNNLVTCCVACNSTAGNGTSMKILRYGRYWRFLPITPKD